MKAKGKGPRYAGSGGLRYDSVESAEERERDRGRGISAGFIGEGERRAESTSSMESSTTVDRDLTRRWMLSCPPSSSDRGDGEDGTGEAHQMPSSMESRGLSMSGSCRGCRC